VVAKLKEIHLRGRAAQAPDPAARFPALVEIGPGGTALLRRARLCVIGVGSVGAMILAHLARLCPALLFIVDRARYKPESVLTDACVDPAAVGRQKAVVAAHRAKQVSPRSRVMSFAGAFEDLSPADLHEARFDALFLAGDNLFLEVAVAQRCLHLGIPLYHAALHGETLAAETRVYDLAGSASGPCPICSYSDREWSEVGGDAAFSCAPESRAARVPDPARPATMSFSYLCAMAACHAVELWMRRFLGLGATPPDFSLMWSGYRLGSVLTPLERNPDCRCDHTRLAPAVVSGPLPSASAAAVAAAGGVGLTGGTFSLPGYRFVRLGSCGCSSERPLDRFVRVDAPMPRCRKCGERIQAHPFFSTETVPGEWLDAHRSVCLRSLGAAGARAAVVRRNGHASFVSGGLSDDE